MTMLLMLIACSARVSETGGCTVSDTSTTDGTTGDVTEPTSPSEAVVLSGAMVGGEVVDVQLADGRISAIGDVGTLDGEVVDVSGKWLAPAFIDSHVHFAYLDESDAMLDGGVAAAVDMAAPTSFFAADLAPMRMVLSGPMVTGIGGYPTQGWGSNGYGLECADGEEATAAVRSLYDMGARLIKIPRTGSNDLSLDAMAAAIAEANSLKMPVATHATSDELALEASGADLLAHTPTQALSDATVAAWADKAVVSTLAAFGGSESTLGNLRVLKEAGATVLYGTDFGNTRTPGIDPAEITLLQTAGLSGEEILKAGTSAPANFWGLNDLGRIEVGYAASLLVLSEDPTVDPMSLTTPEQVWIEGLQR